MKPYAIIGILGLFILCLISCAKNSPLTADKVNGVYIVKYSHGVETLDLRKDGKYLQLYVSNSGSQSRTNEGKWSFDAATEEVNLMDAFRFDTGRNEPEKTPTKTRWLVKVFQNAGHVYLSLDPDRALVFEKK